MNRKSDKCPYQDCSEEHRCPDCNGPIAWGYKRPLGWKCLNLKCHIYSVGHIVEGEDAE